jgi:DNA repair exonuclease SbcCD ATPase subunit
MRNCFISLIILFATGIMLATSCSNEKTSQVIVNIKTENDSLKTVVDEQLKVITLLFVKLNEIENILESLHGNNYQILQIKELVEQKPDYSTQYKHIRQVIEDYNVVSSSQEQQIKKLTDDFNIKSDSLNLIIKKYNDTIDAIANNLAKIKEKNDKLETDIEVLNKTYTSYENIIAQKEKLTNKITELEYKNSKESKNITINKTIVIIALFVIWITINSVFISMKEDLFGYHRGSLEYLWRLTIVIILTGLILTILYYLCLPLIELSSH